MIPEDVLILLINFSTRDKDFNMVLKENVPEEIVELAKKYYWAPYNKNDSEEIIV